MFMAEQLQMGKFTLQNKIIIDTFILKNWFHNLYTLSK